ncbi:MAG: L-threonylcarbamoyladenylate synthase [Candidatus Thiodiazotropha sp.]
MRLAADRLRRGGVVAYPTESVFGLGCNPLNKRAVMRLLAIKHRDPGKGVILISHDFEQLRDFVAKVPSERLAAVLAQWPGPTTWLLPAAPWVPDWLTGEHETLAMRVTAHPIAAALCRAAGMALVSTSANLSGRPPARTPLQVRARCEGNLDMVLHGQTGGLARPTRIRDALNDRWIR